MTRWFERLPSAVFGLLSLSAATGCGSDTEEGKMIATSGEARLVVYENPYAMMPDAPNTIGSAATASATAWDMGGKLKLSLSGAGLPPDRDFGSHLHKLGCDNGKAGGHYQHTVAPSTEAVSDPMYANPDNEAWLDFKTDSQGKVTIERTVAWLPRPGEAKAIIFHDKKTDMNGKAGDKLACLPLALP